MLQPTRLAPSAWYSCPRSTISSTTSFSAYSVITEQACRNLPGWHLSLIQLSQIHYFKHNIIFSLLCDYWTSMLQPTRLATPAWYSCPRSAASSATPVSAYIITEQACRNLPGWHLSFIQLSQIHYFKHIILSLLCGHWTSMLQPTRLAPPAWYSCPRSATLSATPISAYSAITEQACCNLPDWHPQLDTTVPDPLL
jgi:hypothetical protein